MKRFLSALLCLAMVLSFIPMTAMAQVEVIGEVYVNNVATPIAGRRWQGTEPTVSSSEPYIIKGQVEWYDEREQTQLKQK